MKDCLKCLEDYPEKKIDSLVVHSFCYEGFVLICYLLDSTEILCCVSW